MKTVAIIQARMGSTRLPGKVMRLLCGKSVLAHVIDRVRASDVIDEIIVATSNQPADDAIAMQTESLGATGFRGSEADVLSRYYLAALQCDADTIIRVTSDCPLFDGELLRAMVDAFKRHGDSSNPPDYLSNTLTRTYPRGLDAEIFTFATLERAYREANQAFEREHVTPFIYNNPGLFLLKNFAGDHDYSGQRWTLDTAEDWQLIEALYTALYRPDRLFGTGEILDLLARQPALVALNAHVTQRATSDA